MGCLVLFAIIVLFPFAEYRVVSLVAFRIGFWNTIVLLVLSAVFGSYLAKYQGMVVLARVQQCLKEGRTPTLEMVEGFLVFLGGLLFILPGFISDIMGLFLVFPLTRRGLRWVVLAGFSSRGKTTARSQDNTSLDQRTQKGLDRTGAEDAEVV